MKELLTFLDGKKAVISGILHALNVYLLAMKVIDTNTSVFIATVVALLTGVAVERTGVVLGAKRRAND